MPKRRKERPRGPVPARRDDHRPARRELEHSPADAGASGHRPAVHLPMPEFLSLTYTLPYHLIQQMDRVARETNRSQSEVIAESIRLYLKTVEARREHTRISTVEGFSYQQVAVGETVVEAPPSPGDGSANGQYRDSPAPRPRAVDPEEEWEEEDLDEDDDEQWDEEEWEEDDLEEEEDDEPFDEEEAPAFVGDAPTPGDVAVGSENETAADASEETSSRPSTQETELPADPRTDDRPASAGGAGDAADRGVEAVARDNAANEEPELTSDEAPSVAVAADTQARTELEQIVDPAAEVRRRLRKISGEELGSNAMRSALADIMLEIDVKDFSPNDHSQKVADLARQLGRARGISGEQLLQLEMAALVHDVGKASVPADILDKRRPAPEEMAVIRQYPEFGADLLEIVPSMAPLKKLVASHQERWNGSGYPDGLQGNDVPVGAQIIALCDVYNVLTTERRYRPAYTEDRARQIIRQNIGTLWNPDIARVFLRNVIGDEEA